jgi:hypothetical protein
MLMFMARGTNRLERSTMRVSTGTDENGSAVVEIEGFSGETDHASFEAAMNSQGLEDLAEALSATLSAGFRDGTTVLRLAFVRTSRPSIA